MELAVHIYLFMVYYYVLGYHVSYVLSVFIIFYSLIIVAQFIHMHEQRPEHFFFFLHVLVFFLIGQWYNTNTTPTIGLFFSFFVLELICSH